MNALDLTYHLGRWVQAHPHLLLPVGAGMLALSLAAAARGRGTRPKQTTHGSSRWATPTEIRAAGLMAAQGVVCGRLGRQVLCDDSDTHVAVIAPSRSWKGIGPILATLRGGWRASALVYDPAGGENAAASMAWRLAMGQRVERFTPRSSPQTCINVGDYIRVGQIHEFDDAWTLSASLLAPLALAQDTPVARHFRTLATTLHTAGHLHLLHTTGTTSLGALWTLLTQRYATLKACLTALLTTVHTPHGRHPLIVQLAQVIANVASDRELGSIWSTAMGPLVPFADPLTQRSTDTSTIDLNDLQYGTAPMTLYLTAPEPSSLERLAPLYRVVSEMAMHRLQQHPPRRARHRLLVLADEAPSYGYSRVLDKGAAESAKYGIKLFIVAQDVPQIEAAFGRGNSIWGNTPTKIFFAPDSDLTAKRLSENFLGHTTVEQPVLSRQQALRTRPAVSYQQVGRPLMTPDELRAMHPQAAIVYRTGLRPILCGKVNVLTDAEWR